MKLAAKGHKASKVRLLEGFPRRGICDFDRHELLRRCSTRGVHSISFTSSQRGCSRCQQHEKRCLDEEDILVTCALRVVWKMFLAVEGTRAETGA